MKNFISIILVTLFGCKAYESTESLSIIKSPAITGAQPFLFSGNDGLYLSWQETHYDSLYKLMYSKYDGTGWSDSVTVASGTNWFINWADFPAIAENEKGQIAAHYLPKSGNGTYAYDINIVLSDPDTTFKLHSDSTQTEHGFVSIKPYKDKYFISWLDGRNTSGSDDHHHAGAMSLRAAIINSNGSKEKEWLLDEKVCDCCQTSVAITDEGPIVVYRDRSAEEVRDITYRRLKDSSWSAIKKVADDNWKINGCPVNGPKVEARDNFVVVTWFTGAGDKPKVKMAVSEDYGENFNDPIVVSGNSLGRVDVVINEVHEIWVSHLSLQEKGTYLNARKYNKQGELLADHNINDMSSSRNSGFPQMEEYQKKLYFAWTEVNDSTTIKLKSLNLN